MVVGPYTNLTRTNTFDPRLKGFTKLLRSAVVYGANAAGKSNLLRAIKFMKDFVVTSAAATTGQYQYTPFKLSKTFRTRPSEFQIAFIQKGLRYEYCFAMGPKRIEREWLVEYSHAGARVRGRTMFDRTWDAKKEKYHWKFSDYLKGQRSVWSESTRPDALFLSTAVQLNSSQLLPVFEWFKDKLMVITGDVRLNDSLTLRLLEQPNGKERLMPFLQEADLGITDLTIEREAIPTGGIILNKGGLMLDAPTGGAQPNIVTVTLSHSSDNPKESVGLNFEEESSGTQILFKTAGAWLNVFAKGEVLLFDEIDTNIHPKLLKFLVKKFHSSKDNLHNAQLVCSTHNTFLADQEIFRRDQIWFVEKDRTGSSRLYPLSDFNVRNDEIVDRWYLRGRYGALPLLPDGGE
jgi:AAA15 family ATPase/GTPase